MHTAYKCDITPSSAIFAPKNTWIHVHITDHSNIASDVKVLMINIFIFELFWEIYIFDKVWDIKNFQI